MESTKRSPDEKSIFEISKSQVSKPNILFTHIEEPRLVFANGGMHEDPKEGIRRHGPKTYGTTAHPSSIRIGFVGTPETIDLAQKWCETCLAQITGKEGASLTHLFQDFPGFKTSFFTEFTFNAHWNQQINRNELDRLIRMADKKEGFEGAVGLVTKKVTDITEQDSKPDVIVISLPEEIENYYKSVGKAKPEEKVKLTPAEKRLKQFMQEQKAEGQTGLFGPLEVEDFENTSVYRNFRRALKARVMSQNIPIQILLSSRLKSDRGIQDAATRAWNFCTAMYYKAGGIPWNIAIEKDTCFVGISFYKHVTETSTATHTSLAQVFTDRGDFLVLRGSKFYWDPKLGKDPHLTYDGANNLIKQVLERYKEKTGNLPRRVVIHKSSKYQPEELKGFLEPLKEVEQYDLITLYSTGIRFFRAGDYPVLRGTYCSISDQAHFIFTQGYVPYLETYPSSYVPEPLEIVQHIGDSTKKKICDEIIALSKMNWNNCDFANKKPITLSFAQKVGEILSYIPEGETPNPSYKFYM